MKDKIYSICYFGSLIRFAHFVIMVGEELPSLPPLTVRHWFFIIQIFEQLSGPEKQSPWNFPLCWNIFYLSGLLSNLCLPWKEFVMKFFTAFKILVTFRMYEQLVLSLKNSVPWCHCVEYIFYHPEFWTTCACPETISMKFFTVLKYFIFQSLSNLSCPEMSCPTWVALKRPTPVSYATGLTLWTIESW